MARAFRIGVNALYLIPGGVGGTEIYLRNLLIGLAGVDRLNEYVVYTNRETGADLAPGQSNFRIARQPVNARRRPERILWEQTGLAWAARRDRLDVLFNPGFTCPAWRACPNVTVFHDLQHKRHPEHFRWWDLPFWRLLLWVAARRSQRLISVSEATRQDLREFYGVDSTVVHHGVEPACFEIARQRAAEDFVLCVSTLHPHKNLERLIRVFAGSPELPRLVITGMRGFAAGKLEASAGARVRFTGWIAREELHALFRTARAFVYPSTFEGFGMPVLEAMAAGVPVACSNIPPLREIADGCAFFFDPEDEPGMRAAVGRALQDNSLVEAARERAAAFTWENAARETLRVLTEAASA